MLHPCKQGSRGLCNIGSRKTFGSLCRRKGQPSPKTDKDVTPMAEQHLVARLSHLVKLVKSELCGNMGVGWMFKEKRYKLIV